LWVEEEEEAAKNGRTVLAAQEVLAEDSAALAPAPATQDRTCVASAPRTPAEETEGLLKVSAAGATTATAAAAVAVAVAVTTGGCVTEEGVAIDSVTEVTLDDSADLRRLRKGEEEATAGRGGEETCVRCKLVMMRCCLGVGVGVAFGATWVVVGCGTDMQSVGGNGWWADLRRSFGGGRRGELAEFEDEEEGEDGEAEEDEEGGSEEKSSREGAPAGELGGISRAQARMPSGPPSTQREREEEEEGW
jgi:hypothetical protein